MDLILFACLLAAPDDCREHRVRISLEAGNTLHCMAASPQYIADWGATHPNWTLKSWRCENDAGDEKA